MPGAAAFPDWGDLRVGSRSDLERQARHLRMQGPAELVAPALAAAAWSRRVPGLGRFARGLTLGTGAAGAAPRNARPRGAGGTSGSCSGLAQTHSRLRPLAVA